MTRRYCGHSAAVATASVSVLSQEQCAGVVMRILTEGQIVDPDTRVS